MKMGVVSELKELRFFDRSEEIKSKIFSLRKVGSWISGVLFALLLTTAPSTADDQSVGKVNNEGDTPVTATAEDSRETLKHRWIPRAELNMALIRQVATALGGSTITYAENPGLPPLGSTDPGINSRTFTFQGVAPTQAIAVGSFGLGLGVSTPALIKSDSWGAPRVVVSAVVNFPFSDQFNLDQNITHFGYVRPSITDEQIETNPLYRDLYGETWANCNFNRQLDQPVKTAYQTNQCDQTIALEFSIHETWSLQMGLAITLPVADRQFILTPGIRYFGQRVSFNGTGERTDRAGDYNPDYFLGDVAQRYTSPATEKFFVLHGIGVSLAAEAVVAKVGPTNLVVFLEPSFNWLLNLEDVYQVSGSGSEAGVATGASFSASLDQMVIQISSGLRILWTGN